MLPGLTLEQIYFLSQIVSATAVVISLLFVGLQLRHNTRALEIAGASDVLHRMSEFTRLLADNGEVAAIFRTGVSDFAALDPVARQRFYTMVGVWLWDCEALVVQMNAGTLSPSVISAKTAQLIDFFSIPTVAGVWRERRHWFTAELQQFVENTVLPQSAHTQFSLPGEQFERG
ncbi:MAG: hypothetical protein HYX63_15230 [Gammaproteobacteria bacterium]|nr:hypothetical protein [Gammaproteobacteria bacterium]